MKVIPQYYNTSYRTEPTIQGLAKFNVHTHSYVRSSVSLLYRIHLGDLIKVKDLCEDLMTSPKGRKTRVVGLSRNSFIINTPTTAKEYDSTVVETEDDCYRFLQTYKEGNRVESLEQDGFASENLKKSLRRKSQNLYHDLSTELFFFRHDPWVLRAIYVRATDEFDIELIKDGNSFITFPTSQEKEEFDDPPFFSNGEILNIRIPADSVRGLSDFANIRIVYDI
jgi:hypothetical protein